MAITDFFFLYTQTKWQAPESKPEHAKLSEAIDAYIAQTKAAIASRVGTSPSWETQLLQRAEWFKSVLSNPWGHPVLRLLLNPTGEKPSDKEGELFVLTWLGGVIVIRL